MKHFFCILIIIAIQVTATSNNSSSEPDSIVRVVDIEANGMTFTCRTMGNKATGKPVILLHGWPETSHMWIELMKKLSAEGYYCVAPNQRGYSDGARPKKAKDYDLKYLAEDIIAIADAQGFDQFHLIGHDWGSAVGWAVITLHAPRISSWTALSVPHVQAFSEAIRTDKQQKKMSGYIRFFQLRAIPEWLLTSGDCKRLRAAWNKSSPQQVIDYLSIFSNKKALKTTLHWYRGNYKTLKKGKSEIEFGAVNLPTLLIWGNKDMAIGRRCMELTNPYMKGAFKFVELDAGHWLIQEQLQIVSKEIIEHLKKYPL